MHLVLATFASVMATIGYILIALLALVFMIVIHELGHYLAGKALKFKINEFAIGFGPPIFKRVNKKSGEVFSIRPIPLGGFCQFEDEDAASQSTTAFNNQPAWKRLIVLFAGAFFNLVAALVIITFIFTFHGQVLPGVHTVYNDSPNKGILMEGDVIIAVNGRQLNVLTADDAGTLLSKSGETAKLKIIRDGKVKTIEVKKGNCVTGTFDAEGNFEPTLDDDGNPVTYYGFGFNSFLTVQKLGFFRSFGRSFSFMFFLVYKILWIIGQLFTGGIGMENVGGPITTISVISDAAREGFTMLTYAICLISANLAVMNLLPLPALDGSRMVFCIIEMIFKKPVKKSVEAAIHTVGFFLLLGFAFFAEIYRFIKMH